MAASFLQNHPNCQLYLDNAAGSGLTRLKSPWVLGPLEWDALLLRKAVIWLAGVVAKPILSLTDEDYNEHSLQVGLFLSTVPATIGYSDT